MSNQKQEPTAAPSHDEDIVSRILADRKAKEQAANPTAIQTCVIDNNTFFIDNNPMGCMLKVDFIGTVLNGLNANELNEFNLWLMKLSGGEKVDFKPLAWSNKGKDWFFCQFNYRNGQQRYKIPAVSQMASFLVLYQAGVVSLNNVTLAGLHEVALATL